MSNCSADRRLALLLGQPPRVSTFTSLLWNSPSSESKGRRSPQMEEAVGDAVRRPKPSSPNWMVSRSWVCAAAFTVGGCASSENSRLRVKAP